VVLLLTPVPPVLPENNNNEFRFSAAQIRVKDSRFAACGQSVKSARFLQIRTLVLLMSSIRKRILISRSSHRFEFDSRLILIVSHEVMPIGRMVLECSFWTLCVS
jgi:hypothetical protein